MSLNGAKREILTSYSSGTSPRGIDLDGAGQLYWIRDPEVQRSNPAGTGREVVYTAAGLTNLQSMAIDADAGMMYLADAQFEPHISKVGLDGLNPTSFYTSLTAGGISDIEIDLDGGKFYWLERAEFIGGTVDIRRANLDGSDVEDLVTAGGSRANMPRGLAVDPVGGKFYWTESGFCGDGDPGRILSANLDGSGVDTVVTGLGVLGNLEVVR